MRINWTYIKAFLLLTLVVFLVAFSNVKNSSKKINAITIEFTKGENLFMNQEMVNKLLIQNSESPKNVEKSVLDLHKLEAKLRKHPMVEDAAIYVTVDGQLKTEIKQRTPIARINASNRSYYIDTQSEIMPLSSMHTSRVLLFSGTILENEKSKIHYLASTILKDDFLRKQIIGASKIANNEYVLQTRIGEQKIILGKIENVEAKLKNLKYFFNKTMLDKTINNYATINLKYNNQVVCLKLEENGTE